MIEKKITAEAALNCTVRRGKFLKIYWVPKMKPKEGGVWIVDTIRKVKGKTHRIHIQITDESLNVLLEARYRMTILGEGKPGGKS